MLPVVAVEVWGGKGQRTDVEPPSRNRVIGGRTRRKRSLRKWNRKISVTYENTIKTGHTVMESNNGVLEQGFCEIAQYHLGDIYVDCAVNFLPI